MIQFHILLNQLIQFFIILLIGYVAARYQMVKEVYLPELSRIIMKIVLPVYIFTSIFNGTTIKQLINGIPVLFLSIAIYVIFILTFSLLAKILKLPGERGNVYQALFIFGNTAIIALPLINEMYPKEGIIYLALFAIIDQLIFWTYGIWLTTSKQQGMKANLKNFINPSLVAVALSILLIVIRVKLPIVLNNTLNTVGKASTAMCLIYLGSLFYFSNWKKVLNKREIYIGIVFKMILIPLIIGIVLHIIDLSLSMRGTMVILSALPTMTVIPMLVKPNSEEKEYAIGATLFTMAVSLITLPIVTYLVL
jgi:Predicted permeases